MDENDSTYGKAKYFKEIPESATHELRKIVHELNNIHAIILGNLNFAITLLSQYDGGTIDVNETLLRIQAAERNLLAARKLSTRISDIGKRQYINNSS
jgi:hypothetical protein